MTIDTKDIVEVRQITLTSVCSERPVNDLLAAGWILLSCAVSPEANDLDARTLYVLGRPVDVAASPASRASTFGLVPA